MRPGEAIWSVATRLNVYSTVYLKGGLANQSCPAHPSSCLDQQGDANNWETSRKGAKGVLLRCATHDAIHIKWLLEQEREGHISKEKVGAYLCQEDKDGSCLLSLLDIDVQEEVATWNREAAEKIAHKLSLDFVQWLIEEAREGKWDKEAIGSIVWRKNKDDIVIFSLLDLEAQKELAYWNQEETIKNAHLTSLPFIQWFIKEAREGKWDKEEVGSIVCRENKEGAVILSLLDFETQRELAEWNRGKAIEAAHLLGPNFVDWLIQMAMEDNWSKKDVGSVVCRKNANNRLILAKLDEETQRQVAEFNKAMTCSAIPYMEDEGDFLHWLHQEAIEDRWDQEMVFRFLQKEKVDGTVVVRIQKGLAFKMCSSKPQINICFSLQPWKSPALVLGYIIKAPPWAGLTSSVERSRMRNLRFTDKLTREKYRGELNYIFCTGKGMKSCPFASSDCTLLKHHNRCTACQNSVMGDASTMNGLANKRQR